MNKKSVLIASYYWPPSGGAAVQRWLSFANELCEAGWQVHILTVAEKWATYQLYDESLVNQINPRIQIHTTKTLEPFGVYKKIFGKESIPKPAFSNEASPSFSKKIARFVRGNFFIPDPRKGWTWYAIPMAKAIIKKYSIQNIITAGPPHSTHFIGKALKESKKVYWIADFHDLWTDVIYYDMLYHTALVKKWDRKLEKNILEKADHVITVGDQYKEKLLQKSDAIKPEKISVLRIGYDDKMFPLKVLPRQNAFVITYTGSIADFYHPGVFIEALKKVVKIFPHIKFILRFVGVLSAGIKNKIIAAGMENILEETGYVPHSTSVSYLQDSTILLLVNPVTKDESMVIPGKIYEYLAAQKPIINITVHSAETAKLIDKCNAGKTFERTEEELLYYHLENLVEKWISGQDLLDRKNIAQVKEYARNEITKTLIQFLQ